MKDGSGKRPAGISWHLIVLGVALALAACSMLVATPPAEASGTPETAGWQTYTDIERGFSFKYPPELTVETAYDNATVFVGEKMRVTASPRDPLTCQGECPVIESSEPVTLAGQPATHIGGYIGSIGGNVPQYFTGYIFSRDNFYLTFVLYAESRFAMPTEPSVISPLKPPDVELFERILQTLQFTK